jgi:hypothetical protein
LKDEKASIGDLHGRRHAAQKTYDFNCDIFCTKMGRIHPLYPYFYNFDAL